ncbi:MAG: D-amino acid dehydrogenase [Minwuia sp.]|uniref:D-amino acid dehydrogenase n=1 Tax=Minwuia sp. TaxID=2493630 RepID=UPI003A8B94B6
MIAGAGVIGVTTAWELASRGHEVTVIEAAPGPAEGASFANGAQISPSESVPWASPSNLRMAVKWMWQADGPFRLKPTADTRQWGWLVRFLANCRQNRWEANARPMVAMALYSQQRLAAIRDAAGIDYDREDRGILRIFPTAPALHEAGDVIGVMAGHGVDMRMLGGDEIAELEPALGPALEQGRIAGGILAPGDETGDAAGFTAGLAAAAAREGVRFAWNSKVERIVTHGDRFHAVETPGGRIGGDALIVCAGLGAPQLTRRLGFDLPIYPLKGYSVTRRLGSSNLAPRISITDEGRRMVISRLGGRIRAAGKADLVGYDPALKTARAGGLMRDLERIYPALDYDGPPEYWTGLRPMTPNGIPLIGTTPVQGVYLNTGHGSLGWTMACGSAGLIADILDGRTPALPARDYRPVLF